MKGRRHAFVAAGAVVLALVVQIVLSRFVAGRDVLSAVVTRFDPALLVALAILLGTRLFLWLLAPGWLLYVGARAWLERGR